MESSNFLVRRLNKLHSIQRRLAKQLDRAFVKGRVTQYLSLEEKYKENSLIIEKLSKKLTHTAV